MWTLVQLYMFMDHKDKWLSLHFHMAITENQQMIPATIINKLLTN